MRELIPVRHERRAAGVFKPMTPRQQLTEAEGWIELGNVEEGFKVLDDLPPAAKASADVIALRLRGYHQAGLMDYAILLAPILRTHAPDKLPAEFCFDFACMQSREGDTEEAEKWLEVAFENADDVDAMRLKALDHADLEPVWGQIGWV